jgi:hypothetical protein
MTSKELPDSVEIYIDSKGQTFGYFLNAEGDTLGVLEFSECDCGEHPDARCLLAKVQWEPVLTS